MATYRRLHRHADAAANVLPAAKLRVKPADTTSNRTFSRASGREWGNTHSNPVDDRENFSQNLPADSPRNPTGAFAWAAVGHLRRVLGTAAADFAGTACVVAASHARWRDNGNWPATETTGEHPVGKAYYNSAPTDAWVEMHARNLSTDSGACEVRIPLDSHDDGNTLEEGPREVVLPLVKSRSEAPTSLRGDFNTPHPSTVIQPHKQS